MDFFISIIWSYVNIKECSTMLFTFFLIAGWKVISPPLLTGIIITFLPVFTDLLFITPYNKPVSNPSGIWTRIQYSVLSLSSFRCISNSFQAVEMDGFRLIEFYSYLKSRIDSRPMRTAITSGSCRTGAGSDKTYLSTRTPQWRETTILLSIPFAILILILQYNMKESHLWLHNVHFLIPG